MSSVSAPQRRSMGRRRRPARRAPLPRDSAGWPAPLPCPHGHARGRQHALGLARDARDMGVVPVLCRSTSGARAGGMAVRARAGAGGGASRPSPVPPTARGPAPLEAEERVAGGSTARPVVALRPRSGRRGAPGAGGTGRNRRIAILKKAGPAGGCPRHAHGPAFSTPPRRAAIEPCRALGLTRCSIPRRQRHAVTSMPPRGEGRLAFRTPSLGVLRGVSKCTLPGYRRGLAVAVVYDLLREFSWPTVHSRSLFGRLSHRQ